MEFGEQLLVDLHELRLQDIERDAVSEGSAC